MRYTWRYMKDRDEEVTFSDREIVLEFFPATKEQLVPRERRYIVEDIGDGKLEIKHISFEKRVVLTPIERSGESGTLLSCDLCHHSAQRSHMVMYRAHVPEDRQHFKYVSLCGSRKNCEERRISHNPIATFERLFEN